VAAVGVTGELEMKAGCGGFVGNIGTVSEQDAEVVGWGASHGQLQIGTTIPVVINPGQQQTSALTLDQAMAVDQQLNAMFA
jgi:hypothetical protein